MPVVIKKDHGQMLIKSTQHSLASSILALKLNVATTRGKIAMLVKAANEIQECMNSPWKHLKPGPYRVMLRMYCIDRPRVPLSNDPCIFHSLYD